MAVWPSKVKQKRRSASARSSTPSTRSTRRSRNRWNGSYHSRSQWVGGTRYSSSGGDWAVMPPIPVGATGPPARLPLRRVVLQQRGHAGQVGGDGRVVLVGQAPALGAGVQLGHPLRPGQAG